MSILQIGEFYDLFITTDATAVEKHCTTPELRKGQNSVVPIGLPNLLFYFLVSLFFIYSAHVLFLFLPIHYFNRFSVIFCLILRQQSDHLASLFPLLVQTFCRDALFFFSPSTFSCLLRTHRANTVYPAILIRF